VHRRVFTDTPPIVDFQKKICERHRRGNDP